MRLILKLLRLFFSLIVLFGLLLTYSIFIEPKLLITDTLDIGPQYTQSNIGETITIVQFSDTHLGFHFDLAQLKKVVEHINSLTPDIVVFTGDLIDEASTYTEIEQVAPILAQIEAPLGKYAIYGNHDYGGGAHRYYDDIMAQSGFLLLVNEVHRIILENNAKLEIGGLDEIMLGKPDIEKITADFSPLAVHLLLLHEPDYIDQFTTLPHVALAGHSHGGQVQLPFLGPIIHTAYGEKYVEGSYFLNGKNLLYVNIGLGTTKLPIRFAAIPTITEIKLTL